MQLISFGSLSSAENAALVKLISYKVDYNKLWGTETGRSLDGTFSGSIIGVFPKLTITIRASKKPIVVDGTSRNAKWIESKLLSVFNREYETITYYDPYKNENKTKTFYFGDITSEVAKAVTSGGMKFNQLTIEAVATTKL